MEISTTQMIKYKVEFPDIFSYLLVNAVTNYEYFAFSTDFLLVLYFFRRMCFYDQKKTFLKLLYSMIFLLIVINHRIFCRSLGLRKCILVL